jgi:hypothetical protein
VSSHRASTTFLLLTAALAAAGCSSGPKRQPVIAEAYAGPAVLKVRSDFPLQSPTVATVKHGEKLEIIGRRRRFLRVRTPGGAEGWTDERQLLGAEDMAALKELAQRAAKLPSQGQATAVGEINIHTQPARQSPSFLQVKENEKMDVLAHITAQRTEQPRKPLIPPPPKKQKSASKKPKAEPKYPPPPMPKPPPAPDNWLELSKSGGDEDEDDTPDEAPEPKVIPTDDWSLVRIKTGQSGWVLTRRLAMAIPDEVAQYAEGKRIVSYFSLGEIQDEDRKKNIWLWTTVGGGQHSYDFDSFRVFIWSLRRHRYETAYIERKITGYAPVLVKEIDLSGGSQSKAVSAAGKYPGFSICLEKSDGTRVRREYVLLTNVIRYAGEAACETPTPVFATAAQPNLPNVPESAPAPKEPLSKRFKEKLRSMTHRWFGR